MTIFDNELPLGILRRKDPETYRALVEWHEAGKPIAGFHAEGWREAGARLLDFFAYRAVREPPTPEEVERLRRKVAAGEKLAALVRENYAPKADDCYGWITVMPEQFVAALREWEAAGD